MAFTYPDEIRALPDADIPIPGVRGKLLQASGTQIVFFEIDPIGAIPAHAHGAQLGLMVEGEMDLTISGVTRRLKGGDNYFIPAGAVHSATFLTTVYVVDVFFEAARYRARPA
jgi:quercetin dioxygenase-like cupin family protein